MALTEDSEIPAPIIIKRKKVVKGDGHHGGAWKVAYADFVTAMMAFFLLMWLLNATTEEQRKGLADYFNPTIPISRISGGGSDGLNGSSIFTEQTFARMGTGATRKTTTETPADEGKGKVDAATIAENLRTLQIKLQESEGHLSEHMSVKLSPEGIVLELADSDDMPLFPVGRSDPTPLLRTLLDVVSGSFDNFDNDIKIVGHTDNRSYREGADYNNWNLSSDRANAARDLLADNGIASHRIREVAGRADTEPLIPEDPSAAQNRRIAIVILSGSIADASKDLGDGT
ncbi:MAG: flagellar motor protein MotB [Hyphomonas sp.]